MSETTEWARIGYEAATSGSDIHESWEKLPAWKRQLHQRHADAVAMAVLEEVADRIAGLVTDGWITTEAAAHAVLELAALAPAGPPADETRPT